MVYEKDSPLPLRAGLSGSVAMDSSHYIAKSTLPSAITYDSPARIRTGVFLFDKIMPYSRMTLFWLKNFCWLIYALSKLFPIGGTKMKESCEVLSFWNHLGSRILPKTWLGWGLTIFSLLAVVFISFTTHRMVKLPFQRSIIYTNAPRIKAEIVPLQISFSAKMNTGKKLQLFEVDEKEFEEKKFPFVITELSGDQVNFWGVDENGFLYLFHQHVSQKYQEILKITGVSLEKVQQGQLNVSYEKDWYTIAKAAFVNVAFAGLIILVIKLVDIFFKIRKNEKKFNATFGKTGEVKA
jgi:hypothetical protein